MNRSHAVQAAGRHCLAVLCALEPWEPLPLILLVWSPKVSGCDKHGLLLWCSIIYWSNIVLHIMQQVTLNATWRWQRILETNVYRKQAWRLTALFQLFQRPCPSLHPSETGFLGVRPVDMGATLLTSQSGSSKCQQMLPLFFQFWSFPLCCSHRLYTCNPCMLQSNHNDNCGGLVDEDEVT
jgi:hypothetical protein